MQLMSSWEDTALNFGRISDLELHEKGSSEEIQDASSIYKIGPAEKTQY